MTSEWSHEKKESEGDEEGKVNHDDNAENGDGAQDYDEVEEAKGGVKDYDEVENQYNTESGVEGEPETEIEDLKDDAMHLGQ